MMWKSLQLLFIQSIRCQWRYNYLPPVKSFKHFSWPSTFGIGLVKNVWMELRSWWWAFTIICNVCSRTTLARQLKSFHPDLNHNDVQHSHMCAALSCQPVGSAEPFCTLLAVQLGFWCWCMWFISFVEEEFTKEKDTHRYCNQNKISGLTSQCCKVSWIRTKSILKLLLQKKQTHNVFPEISTALLFIYGCASTFFSFYWKCGSWVEKSNKKWNHIFSRMPLILILLLQIFLTTNKISYH